MRKALLALFFVLLSLASAHGAPLQLPLVEVPATGSSDTLVVFVSGDGGWAAIDKKMSAVFATHGMPVVGLNALEYFWTRRTPEGMGGDLQKILRTYLLKWRKERVVLVGYSRGADVLPFMASRLPADLLKRVRLVALLGPSQQVEFEFHVSDWWHDSAKGSPTAPEVAKLKGQHVLCMYGSDEADSLCRSISGGTFVTQELRGAHHFDGDYETLANRVLQELK